MERQNKITRELLLVWKEATGTGVIALMPEVRTALLAHLGGVPNDLWGSLLDKPDPNTDTILLNLILEDSCNQEIPYLETVNPVELAGTTASWYRPRWRHLEP